MPCTGTASAFGWGYGHFFAFASLAAVGSGLEVADRLKIVKDAATPNSEAASALFAISAVAIPQALFVFVIWALHRYATRAQDNQLSLVPASAGLHRPGSAGGGSGPAAALGIDAFVAGAIVAIAYNELGHKRKAERFLVR